MQGFSGKANLGNGVNVTWSIVGEDAASGPTNLATAIATGVIGVHATDNAAKINGQNQAAATHQAGINAKPTITTNTVTAADGSSAVTQTPVFSPAIGAGTKH